MNNDNDNLFIRYLQKTVLFLTLAMDIIIIIIIIVVNNHHHPKVRVLPPAEHLENGNST